MEIVKKDRGGLDGSGTRRARVILFKEKIEVKSQECGKWKVDRYMRKEEKKRNIYEFTRTRHSPRSSAQ